LAVCYDTPFAQTVAIRTVVGFFFTKERRSIPIFGEYILLAAFWFFTPLTTVCAQYPEEA
jgi:hypothetical protein